MNVAFITSNELWMTFGLSLPYSTEKLNDDMKSAAYRRTGQRFLIN